MNPKRIMKQSQFQELCQDFDSDSIDRLLCLSRIRIIVIILNNWIN